MAESSVDIHTTAEEEETMEKITPLQRERSELGYNLQTIREDRTLRVIHRPCEDSDVCMFFVHGGGGRAGQFKHLIKKFEKV